MSTRYSEPRDLNERSLRDRAVAAARGDVPFELLITDGILLDVVTGEQRSADVGIVGSLIASVHARGEHSRATEVIPAKGKIVTPGLIDSHMHIESSMITPAEYAAAVVPRGVTTIVWDPHELANVHGIEGVTWALKACVDLPLRVIILAPSCVPAAHGFELSGAEFDADALAGILASPGIGGLAEVMNMRGVIGREDRISGVMQSGLESGKPICGHARGLVGTDLNAFMAAGVTSDHELTSADDLLMKLRAGLTIELRGSHDHLLPEFVSALNELGHLPSTVTLCTDDVFPDDLLKRGGLNDVARRLVAYGMPANWAIQAATLNASHRLARPDLGLIAAGRRADIAIFDDLSDLKADTVLFNGNIVARAGELSGPVPEVAAESLRGSVKCSSFSAGDFRLKSEGRRVKLATIHRPRFTEWGCIEADVEAGRVVKPEEATLISVVHRHGRTEARPSVGFLTGWGTWSGAFCTTVSHDCHNLTVFGGAEEDLACAANAVIDQGGGLAVVKNGNVIAALALPLSGLLSDQPLEQVSADFIALRKAMEQIVTWQPPYLVFKACFGATLACNAGPHQTDQGIADVTRDGPMKSPVLSVID